MGKILARDKGKLRMRHPHRFRVIEGGGEPAAPKVVVRRKGAKDKTIEKFECKPCSAQLNAPYGSLARLRIGGVIINGRLIGGSDFWCCARCQRPHFHIKDHPTK